MQNESLSTSPDRKKDEDEAALESVHQAEHTLGEIKRTRENTDNEVSHLVHDADMDVRRGRIDKEDATQADVVGEMLLTEASAPETAAALATSKPNILARSLRRVQRAIGWRRLKPALEQIEHADALAAETPYDRLERDGYVKEIPSFSEIVADAGTRQETIVRINDDYKASLGKYAADHPFLGSSTLWSSREKFKPFRETVAEGDAIHEVSDVLDQTVLAGGEQAEIAADVRANLTYLGSKEYAEGTAGMASYLRGRLDSDPDTKLFMATTTSIKPKYMGHHEAQPKSDEYLLGNIMKNFTPEEREKYAGRLIDKVEDVDKNDPNVRAIILDDQTISGRQLWDMREALPEQLRATAEANLLVAPSEYVQNGVEYNELKFGPAGWQSTLEPLPIKSYFVAREASADSRVKAYITGINSTGDENFASIIAPMAAKLGRPTPGLVNIVRPYTLE